MTTYTVADVLALQPRQRVRIYYNVARTRSDVYTIVSVNPRTQQVAYSNISQTYRTTAQDLADNLVAVHV